MESKNSTQDELVSDIKKYRNEKREYFKEIYNKDSKLTSVIAYRAALRAFGYLADAENFDYLLKGERSNTYTSTDLKGARVVFFWF